MERDYIRSTVKWNIYIIKLDNRGEKSRFWGKEKLYYTGITTDLGRRMGDHIIRKNRTAFVNKYFYDAIKRPVYVEYLYGTEYEAMQREKQIKRLSVSKKEELISGQTNCLIWAKMNWDVRKLLVWKNGLDNPEMEQEIIQIH